jgi:signal transduction histidine kinase
MALHLRPTMLEDLGLLPALLWHLERYTAQTGVQVAFKHSGVDGRRFPPAVEIAAYRIIQEALTNVARHARVSRASVTVSAGEGALFLDVADDGVGFRAEEVLRRPASAGLAGMRERGAALGGRVEIESAPEAGTRVTATLPLIEEDGAEPATA